ncbi:MAG TPA: hypothetical protein VGG85_07015 [Terracidiphilus sp.]|jgi:hypothetical protein
MTDFSITDSSGSPIENTKVDWTSASSLFDYVKSEALHLIVFPDFLALKDIGLAKAAPKPMTFQLQVGHDFELGIAVPEIDITPGARLTLIVNATAGSNLMDDDSFPAELAVPTQTGYVGMEVTGSLDLGLCGSAGGLTFGIDANQSISIEYLKAFPLNAGEPTLGAAAGQMLSSFVIPAQIADLERLHAGDVCMVSGEGCLKVSGGFDVTAPINPLASVKLPLGVGNIDVQDGVMAGVTASFNLRGGFQIRVRMLANGAVELSYFKHRGTAWEADLSGSAGVQVELGSTDLLAALLGAISKTHFDPNMLSGLTSEEAESFQSAIKKGIDHSLEGSLAIALSTTADDAAAFQYELDLGLFDATATAAVSSALRGDLSGLTLLEARVQPGGMIAPGVKLLNSLLTQMRSRGATLNVNLLGIVNLTSISKLVSQCEFLTEYGSGDLVIKETASGDHISAIVNPMDRQEALRRAIFDSVMVTTTYMVSQAVSLPVLKCGCAHFADNANTNSQTLSDYLNWFIALDLLSMNDRQQVLSKFSHGETSSCVVRIDLDDASCESLFLNASGDLRAEQDYQETGRKALLSLLDSTDSDIDAVRARMLSDPLWQQAANIGPSPALQTVLPISSTDPRFGLVLPDVIGDVYQVLQWAHGMRKAGEALQDMRTFLAGRDPSSLANDSDFAQRRDQLQKRMSGVVSTAQMRFQEPWGLVSLFHAASAAHASGLMRAGSLVIQR